MLRRLRLHQRLQRLLTGTGKGQALLQVRPKGVRKGGAVQRLRHDLQGGQVTALAAEGQVGDPQGVEDLDAPTGEGLSRGHRPLDGQFHHQIRTAPQRHLRPSILADDGRLPPLGEGAAHGTDHRRTRQGGLGLGDEMGVSPMEGVKFCDDPDASSLLHSRFLLAYQHSS